jgi:outer membrane protein, multidrug efflux system
VAEALRLPTLSLTGSGGVLSSQFDNLLESGSAAYTIGPRLAGPIFDAGRGKARVDAAKALAGEALAAHDRAAKQAFREAADSINAHLKTGEIITEQQRLVDANRKVATVANERFQGGESSYLEVLDAERSFSVPNSNSPTPAATACSPWCRPTARSAAAGSKLVSQAIHDFREHLQAPLAG